MQDADSAYPNFSGTQIIERLVMHNNLRSAKWLAAYLLSLKDRRVLSNDPIDWLGAQIEKEPVTELRKHFIESAKSQLVTLWDAIAQSRDSTQQEAGHVLLKLAWCGNMLRCLQQLLVMARLQW